MNGVQWEKEAAISVKMKIDTDVHVVTKKGQGYGFIRDLSVFGKIPYR